MSDVKGIVNKILEGVSVREALSYKVDSAGGKGIDTDSIDPKILYKKRRDLIKKIGKYSQQVVKRFFTQHFDCTGVPVEDFAWDYAIGRHGWIFWADVVFLATNSTIDGVPLEFFVRISCTSDVNYNYYIGGAVMCHDEDENLRLFYDTPYNKEFFEVSEDQFFDEYFVDKIYSGKLEHALSQSPIVSIMKDAIKYYKEHGTIDDYPKLVYA